MPNDKYETLGKTIAMSTIDFILASRSPRRAEILKQLGYQFDTVAADIDETPLMHELSIDYVKRLASEKALSVVARGNVQLPVLASDTTVALGNAILGKPSSPEEALDMLTAMSGKSHFVHTAIAVYHLEQLRVSVSTSQVWMANVPLSWLEAYVKSGEPLDKAGAYGIQGMASRFIERMDGSYSGVMGLPIYETTQLLVWAGVQPMW